MKKLVLDKNTIKTLKVNTQIKTGAGDTTTTLNSCGTSTTQYSVDTINCNSLSGGGGGLATLAQSCVSKTAASGC